MRLELAIVILSLSLFVAGQASEATDVERELRRLDKAAAEAIRSKDEAAIDQYFLKDAVTNNPRNTLTMGTAGIKELIKVDVIDYTSFERNIESVQLHGKTAIVMGNETVVMAARDAKPAETLRRRYTNIWMKLGDKWKIVARHANIVCP